jgi:hypothetical protein
MGTTIGRGVTQVPLILSKKDLDTLRFLATVRYATAEDVAHIIASPGSLTSVRTRLSRLAGSADYQPRYPLYRFPAPTLSGNSRRVFTLTRTGGEILAHELELKVNGAKRFRVVGYSFLRHALALTKSVVAARVWVRRQQELALRECRLSYELERLPTLSVVPDLWLRFSGSRDGHCLWWEVDCATAFQKAWKQRFRARVEFIRSGGLSRAFGVPGALVTYLVVGPTGKAGDARRQRLCGYAREVLASLHLEPWAAIVRVGSVVLEAFYEQGIFQNALWYRPDQPDHPIPLLSV